MQVAKEKKVSRREGVMLQMGTLVGCTPCFCGGKEGKIAVIRVSKAVRAVRTKAESPSQGGSYDLGPLFAPTT